MTVQSFVKRYKLIETGKNCIRYIRRTKQREYLVVFYPDGDICAEISNYKRNTVKYIDLSE